MNDTKHILNLFKTDTTQLIFAASISFVRCFYNASLINSIIKEKLCVDPKCIVNLSFDAIERCIRIYSGCTCIYVIHEQDASYFIYKLICNTQLKYFCIQDDVYTISEITYDNRGDS